MNISELMDRFKLTEADFDRVGLKIDEPTVITFFDGMDNADTQIIDSIIEKIGNDAMTEQILETMLIGRALLMISEYTKDLDIELKNHERGSRSRHELAGLGALLESIPMLLKYSNVEIITECMTAELEGYRNESKPPKEVEESVGKILAETIKLAERIKSIDNGGMKSVQTAFDEFARFIDVSLAQIWVFEPKEIAGSVLKVRKFGSRRVPSLNHNMTKLIKRIKDDIGEEAFEKLMDTVNSIAADHIKDLSAELSKDESVEQKIKNILRKEGVDLTPTPDGAMVGPIDGSIAKGIVDKVMKLKGVAGVKVISLDEDGNVEDSLTLGDNDCIKCDKEDCPERDAPYLGNVQMDLSDGDLPPRLMQQLKKMVDEVPPNKWN